MACATLKRSPEWEAAQLQQPAKRRRCAPLQRAPLAAPPVAAAAPASPFAEPHVRFTQDKLLQELCGEIKKMQHRRQLRMAAPTSSRADCDGSSSGSEGDSPRPVYSRVLFTFKQVRTICEHMLREQEVSLRTEYDAALCGKLAEQYESFVRFNLDQVQRLHIPTHDISYLS